MRPGKLLIAYMRNLKLKKNECHIFQVFKERAAKAGELQGSAAPSAGTLEATNANQQQQTAVRVRMSQPSFITSVVFTYQWRRG